MYSLFTGHRLLISYADAILNELEEFGITKGGEWSIGIDYEQIHFYKNGVGQKIQIDGEDLTCGDEYDLFCMCVFLIAEKRGHSKSFSLSDIFLRLFKNKTHLLKHFSFINDIAERIKFYLPSDNYLLITYDHKFKEENYNAKNITSYRP